MRLEGAGLQSPVLFPTEGKVAKSKISLSLPRVREFTTIFHDYKNLRRNGM